MGRHTSKHLAKRRKLQKIKKQLKKLAKKK